MPDLRVTFGGNAFLLLLFPVLAGLAVHLYRRPGYPASRAQRWLLFLRISALLVAVILLAEPILALTFRGTRSPLIALLVDDSASMSIEEAGRSRGGLVLDLLQRQDVVRSLRRVGDVRAFAFAESLRTVDLDPRVGETLGRQDPSRSLGWKGTATDLGRAFSGLAERAEGRELSSVLLISDGGANVGQPAEKAVALLGVPVFAVGVGDPTEPKDIAVVSATCDPVAIAGEELPVRVTLRSYGFPGRRIALEIRTPEGPGVTRSLLLGQGEQQVDVTLKSPSVGRHICEARVLPQPEERSAANNSAFFSMEVLRGKSRVLVVSGSPNPDLAYLRRLLVADRNKEIDVLVLAGKEGLRRADRERLTELKDDNLVVLVDLPASALAGAESALAAFVRAGGGLLVLGGPNSFDSGYGQGPLKGLLPVLPVEAGTSYQPDRFQLDFPEASHPVLSLSDDPDADARARAEWPPLLAFNRTLGLRPGAVPLATHPRAQVPGGGRMPMVALATFGTGRVAAVPCATIYRLDALMWGIGKTGETPSAFWRNLFQWLLTPETTRRVRILPDRPVWKSGEPVSLKAFVYDPLMRPARGGEVTVVISDPLSPRTATFAEAGEGIYLAQVRGMPPGDHRFEGKAVVDGKETGTDSGSFTVSAVALEFETLRMDEALLRRIAGVSGGVYCRPEGLPALLEGLRPSPRTVSDAYRFQVGGNPYALALFVALLATEWTLRRRRGML